MQWCLLRKPNYRDTLVRMSHIGSIRIMHTNKGSTWKLHSLTNSNLVQKSVAYSWNSRVLFSHLANHPNRLTTRDPMWLWGSNHNVECIFCQNADETHDHLFFLKCSIFGEIQRITMLKLLESEYSAILNQIDNLLTFLNEKNKHNFWFVMLSYHVLIITYMVTNK